jgi:hypothetical protein
MSSITDVTTLVQAAAAVVVAVAGGIWTYATFLRRRQHFPRAELIHAVTSRPAGLGLSLLHVDLRVENKGEVLLSIHEAELCVQQVLPLAVTARDLARRAAAREERGAEVAGWPTLVSRTSRWEPGVVELEPGESHSLASDILISDRVATVRIVSRIRNSHKHRRIWWETAALHDVVRDSEVPYSLAVQGDRS